jgi:EAL domain-containing protein (putative c-di-GMP-specific phosphodiesterase class I)
LKNAGVALDRAKSLGGNNYQFYRSDMNARALERLTLEADLRRAVENEELVLHYQPQIDFANQQIVGAEALVRWQHPKLGLLPPAEFIPMAEDTGLILPIGDWVLRTACNQAALWEHAGLGNLRVAVNVSARQFQQKNFLERVAQIVDETAISPSSLELEITESSIMPNAAQVVVLLSELKHMGVRIAIDDFGIGYSSLGYLKRLPIDRLKIDRTFVSDATSDPDDAAIVMAIITLAHSLRLKVMAEGVETEEQLRFLQLLKCDEGQGYLFGKPMPADLFLTAATEAGAHQHAQPLFSVVQ